MSRTDVRLILFQHTAKGIGSLCYSHTPADRNSAKRTLLRRLAACVDMTAVKANPALALIVRTEQPARTHKLSIVLKAPAVSLLDCPYHFKFCGNFAVPLISCDTCKIRIHIMTFSSLSADRKVKQLLYIIGEKYRISCCNVNIAHRKTAHKLLQYLRVLTFLLGSEPEQPCYDSKLLLLCGSLRKKIACLSHTFPCKRPHKSTSCDFGIVIYAQICHLRAYYLLQMM